MSDVIDVRLHEENGTWWAESEQIPGLSVVADSRAQLVDALRGAVAFALEIDPDERNASPTYPAPARYPD